MGIGIGGSGVRFACALASSLLLVAAPAAAEPFQSAGGGVFLGYTLGEGGGLQWGIEGFATRYLESHTSCEGSRARHGVGPLLRLSAVRLSKLELTLAAHGGGDLPDRRFFAGIDGELGASLLFESGRGVRAAPHSGLLLEWVFFHAYARQAWLFESETIEPELSFGGGARFWPTFGEAGICEF